MKKINLYQKLIIPGLKNLTANCPFVVQKKIAEFLLQQVFCQTAEDGDLDFLNKRCAAIEISDINYRASLTLEINSLEINSPKNSRLKLVSTEPNHPADVCISGELSAFTQLANRNCDPDSLFFQRRLCIEGDTELGLQVKNLIDTVELDELPLWIKKALTATQFIDSKFA